MNYDRAFIDHMSITHDYRRKKKLDFTLTSKTKFCLSSGFPSPCEGNSQSKSMPSNSYSLRKKITHIGI